MDDGGVHLLTETLPSLVNNLWWNIVMDDWNLDGKVIVIATLSIYIPPTSWRGMTTNVEFTFSVGGTTPRFTISIEQEK